MKPICRLTKRRRSSRGWGLGTRDWGLGKTFSQSPIPNPRIEGVLTPAQQRQLQQNQPDDNSFDDWW
ncbi:MULTISPECIES: hypothetical protein [Cyanophyceae]|uniref:hypothetical protein n=1 Tax=Cyanophyceae TaxID=3028117 RepID=UPI00168627A1|nr:hypothetical protein [Trichocoleus sp. FACHB-69]